MLNYSQLYQMLIEVSEKETCWHFQQLEPLMSNMMQELLMDQMLAMVGDLTRPQNETKALVAATDCFIGKLQHVREDGTEVS